MPAPTQMIPSHGSAVSIVQGLFLVGCLDASTLLWRERSYTDFTRPGHRGRAWALVLVSLPVSNYLGSSWSGFLSLRIMTQVHLCTVEQSSRRVLSLVNVVLSKSFSDCFTCQNPPGKGYQIILENL